MKKIILSLSILLLAACASSEAEKQKPVYTAHSPKSPYQFSQCLAPKWLALNPTTVNVADARGYRISFSDEGSGVISLAKIELAHDGGSNINVYKVTERGRDRWIDATRSCSQ